MSDVTSTTSRGPSRRAVVRTAAHAAWAVPAIQIAVAAPAFASSHVNDIQNPLLTLTSSGKGGMVSTADAMSVGNDGFDALSANSVELTITITGGPAGSEWGSFDLTNAPAWSLFGASGTGIGTKELKFRYAGPVAKGTSVLLPGKIVATQRTGGGTKSATLTYVGPP